MDRQHRDRDLETGDRQRPQYAQAQLLPDTARRQEAEPEVGLDQPFLRGQAVGGDDLRAVEPAARQLPLQHPREVLAG